eukprot:428467_1
MGNLKSKRKNNRTKQKDEYHVVLLGTGHSGTSTIFNQVDKIYNEDPIFESPNGNIHAIESIRYSILQMVNLILSELVNSYGQNDKYCDISFLNVFENEEKNGWTELIKASNARYGIWGKIESTKNQPDMKQKLTDCIENTIPKIKYVMKQTFSTIFDLNNLSHCISLLFMFSREDFERFGNQRKIEIDEWDKLLDNTININTATVDEISYFADTLHDMIGYQCCDRCLDNMQSFGKALHKVWKELEQFKYIYNNIGVKFERAYIENMDYYFNKCVQVFHKDFKPNHEDITRMYIRTVGCIDNRLNISGCWLNITDTAGQKNEGRKWLYCFKNGCDAILYVVGLDLFRHVLPRDYRVNAMKESIDCFQDVLIHKLYGKFKLILVLNKTDLFKQSLKLGHKLSICFANEYKGMNYDKMYDINVINVFITNSLRYNG